MCGVFGYFGQDKRDLSGFLLQGLKKLEYRGYDSSGIAIKSGDRIQVVRTTGEINNLQKKLGTRKISGSAGIGHTRWATHGGVSVNNSHPHTDCGGNLAIVHNGIIENYEEIKRKPLSKGHKFKSQTDSEVFAHLVEENLKNHKHSLMDAVRVSFKQLEGLNSVVVLSNEGEMAAFKVGSPLSIGKLKDNNYLVSSDLPTLLEYTNKVYVVKEEEGVYFGDGGAFLTSVKSKILTKPKFTSIKSQKIVKEKKHYEHFLLKEIHEQGEVVNRVANSKRSDIKLAAKFIKDAWGTYFAACGTAAHAGLAATYFFSEIAKRHVNFSYGSEFPYIEDFLVPRSLLIAASQSGETMDTLEAVRAAKKHDSKILAIVNVTNSSLSRLSDLTLHLGAGAEYAVLSTKAYTAKLSLFLLFAYEIAGNYQKGVNLIHKVAKEIKHMFQSDLERKVKLLAKNLVNKDHIYVIGRGVNYATALEGALKIKEASYIHAEGFAAGELKHGVIALIEKGTPCLAIVANDRAKGAVLSNVMELKARGAYIVGVSCEDSEFFDYWLKVPDVDNASPIVSVIPFQLLAYYLTILKGYNPDRPRNLAKSVTVK